MSADKPDVSKLKRKKRTDELVKALQHRDPDIRAQAALALGEIGDRTVAIDVIAAAEQSSARAQESGAWDPGEMSRVVLKSWATGAAQSKDATVSDSATKVLAAVESQEAIRRGVLLGEAGRSAELREGIPTGELIEALRQTEVEAAPPEPLPEEEPTDQTGQAASADPVPEDAAPAAADPAAPESATGLDTTSSAETLPEAPAPVPTMIPLLGHEGELSMVGIVPGDGLIVSASWDGTLRTWELDTGKNVQVLRGHGAGYVAVALAPEVRLAAAASADGTLRIWDLEQGVTLHNLGEHQHEACEVALTPDGTRLVSGSYDGGLRVWDVSSGRCLHVLERQEGGIEFLTVLADGLRAVSGAKGGTLRLWDLAKGTILQEVGGHHTERVLAVVPDGSVAITSDQQGVLRVWDLVTGGILHTHQDEEAGWVSAAAVTPDGRRALLGYWGGSVLLFDLAEGTADRLDGHLDDVTAITVTLDGNRFVSGSQDGTLIVWDASTGDKIFLLVGHTGLVTALTTTSDGQGVISGSSDTTLAVWRLP